jgi:hypothetical protein
MLHRILGGVAAFGAVALLAAGASAATLSVTKANGDMIAGTGIPADDFTVAAGPNGEEIALKGRLRDTGQALSRTGNRYFVPTGLSADAPGTPAWRFDWQFSPGADGSPLDSLLIEIDFDPTVGEDFSLSTIFGPIDGFWTATDGYFQNPGSGAWNTDDVDFVYSQSWGLHYDFFPDFDPFADGEYTIRFTAFSGVSSLLPISELSTEIVVVVGNGVSVPEPAALGLLGLGLGGLALARRRRKA